MPVKSHPHVGNNDRAALTISRTNRLHAILPEVKRFISLQFLFGASRYAIIGRGIYNNQLSPSHLKYVFMYLADAVFA